MVLTEMFGQFLAFFDRQKELAALANISIENNLAILILFFSEGILGKMGSAAMANFVIDKNEPF